MGKQTNVIYVVEREFAKRYGARLNKLDIKLNKHQASEFGTCCDIEYTFGKSWGSAFYGGKCFAVSLYRVTSLFGQTLCKKTADRAEYTVRDVDSIYIHDKGVDAYNSYTHVRGMANLIKFIKVLRKTLDLKQAALKIRKA